MATGVGRMQGEVRMRSSSNSLVPRAKYIVQLKRLATYHPHPSVELSCSHYLSYLSRAMASPEGDTVDAEAGFSEAQLQALTGMIDKALEARARGQVQANGGGGGEAPGSVSTSGETPGELGIGEREAGWGLRAAPGEGQQPTRQKYGPG